MKTRVLTIRNTKLGEGHAKICIPLLSGKKEELLSEAASVMEMNPEIIEWRTDYFEDVADIPAVLDTLAELRRIIGDIPIIFTCRTNDEGGKLSISDEVRFQLRKEVLESKLVDILDVEFLTEEKYTAPLKSIARENGVYICVSRHHFEDTPDLQSMTRELLQMQERGADIVKLAVMPTCPADVLNLLLATDSFRVLAKIPSITVSMSEMGLLSRAVGGMYGSSVTFCAGVNSSAPGQIDAQELRSVCKHIGELASAN